MDLTGINARIISFQQPVRSVEDASAATGLPPDRFVKTLMVEADGAAILCLVNGADRLDLALVANYLGAAEVRMASRKNVLKQTGYVVGAVPPFGHAKRLRTICDRKISDQGELCFGGGSENALLLISLRELARVSPIEFADLCPTAK